MKTVKEIAKLTGVSICTLRYYDEIGLLKPALEKMTDEQYGAGVTQYIGHAIRQYCGEEA